MKRIGLISGQRPFLAPLVCATAIVAAMLMGGIDARPVRGVDAYHRSAATVIGEVPYRIGDWVGLDIDPQAPAVTLLKPVKILQRKYTNLKDGRWFSMLIVCCTDVRDMVGHYPPRCYPASGWTATGSTSTSFIIGYESIEAVVYGFDRSVDGIRQGMMIYNYFILPTDPQPYTPDMKRLNAYAQQANAARIGATQFQVMIPGTKPSDETRTTAAQVIESLIPAMQIIAKGPAHE